MNVLAKDDGNFIVSAIFGIILAALCTANGCETVGDDGIIRALIPFDIGGLPFWGVVTGDNPSYPDGVPWWSILWPVLTWGTFLVIVLVPLLKWLNWGLLRQPDNPNKLPSELERLLSRDSSPGQILVGGAIISTLAGLFEELSFRWCIFLGMFAMMAFGDVILFGLVSWFHVDILAPVANWATLGYLEPQLFDANWLIGGSIIYTNSIFRDGHSYQGVLGYTNSWFMGMFFFWIMFNFGLWAAIVVHFAYDMWLFTMASIGRALVKPTPW